MEQKIFKKSALVFLHSLRPNKKTIKFASLHTDEYIVLAICHKMFIKYPNLQSVKIASTSARMCLYSHYTHYIYLSMFVAVKRLFIFYCYYYSLLRFVQPEGCGKQRWKNCVYKSNVTQSSIAHRHQNNNTENN